MVRERPPCGGIVVVEIEAGSREACLDETEGYLGRYHPMGYDTRIDAPREQADGRWIAHGSRLASAG